MNLLVWVTVPAPGGGLRWSVRDVGDMEPDVGLDFFLILAEKNTNKSMKELLVPEPSRVFELTFEFSFFFFFFFFSRTFFNDINLSKPTLNLESQ